VSPWIRPWVTETVAETLRRLHPNRLQSYLWSDLNPWMRAVPALAEAVRRQRRQVPPDNPFLELERITSGRIRQGLDDFRDARDRATELAFDAIYGSEWLHALVGLRGGSALAPSAPGVDEAHEALVAQKIAALRSRMAEGGLREAAVRIVLYAGADEGNVDVRGYRMAESIRDEHRPGDPLPAPRRRELVREQYLMLLIDEMQALEALPKLLPTEKDCREALEIAVRILTARGELTPARKERLARVETILANPAAPRRHQEARRS
jgi:hypothetical protein